MTHTVIWWALAAALVIAELLTGTFYLLMLAFAAAMGSIAALAGLASTAQLLIATACALIALTSVRRIRRRRKAARPLNFDIGARIYVDRWHDRAARALYRGAQWDIECAGMEKPADKSWYEIHAVRGNCLVVVASEHPHPSI